MASNQPSEPSEATIRIVVLPDDGPWQTRCFKIRKGGDVVAGHLEVLSDSLVGMKIDVVFQGVIRTWLPSVHAPLDFNNATAEYKFLIEHQKIETTSPDCHRWEGISVYYLPFAFTIPTELISSRAHVHPEYLNLLPTVKESPIYFGVSAKPIHMQPKITYVITDVSTKIARDKSPATKYRTEREIIVMPSIPASPPLQIEYFPHEYKTTCVETLKKRLWDRSLGRLTCSAAEPKPFNISTSAPKASTVASIKLSFQPCGAHTPAATPYEWKFTVKSHLKVRTFYSTKPFAQRPTEESIKLEPQAHMRSSCTHQEIRQCETLSWRSSAGTIAPDTLATPWTTTLMVPVSASKSLNPTFLNVLSARRYALVLHITIDKIHHGPMVLEIPVQITCDDSQPYTFVTRGLSETSRDSEEHQV